MKNLILLLFVIPVLGYSQDGIKWMSWNEAVAQQQADVKAYNEAPNKKTAKPPKKFFVDIYTSWCGWCKRMDGSTFQDPTVVSIMNKYYYPVKFNAEQADPIDFNGHTFVNPSPDKKRVTHQFAASILNNKLSYPAYVILDENVNRLVMYYGYKQVDDLVGILLFYKGNYHLPYKKLIEDQFKQKNNAH